MIKNLISNLPDKEFKNKLQLFGQFIGNWKIHSTWFLDNNVQVEGEGEVSFGWILYGTAIQDVWTGEAINPPKNFPKMGFGTTIRYFDQNLDTWKCIWIDPVSSVTISFIARQKEEEIILEGINKDGNLENWIYSNIQLNVFDWRAEISKDKGKTWKLDQKILATRL